MLINRYEEIKTDKKAYIRFAAMVIGFVLLLYAVWYILDIFLGSIEDDYRNDLSESIAAIKESVELSPTQLEFLDVLGRQCTIDSNLSRFPDSQARLDYVNSVLQQCGATAGGLFINEYEPTQAFTPDQVRPDNSNPFNANE